ncbi:Sel1 repeat protein [compost metagenome]
MIKQMLTLLLAIFSASLMAQDLKAVWNKDCDCYGYKDSKGNLVIPYKYSFALDFSEGMASVRANGKSGFINKDDKAVIPFMYEWSEAFGEGLAAVQLNGKWGFINNKGKQIIPFTYDDAKVFHEGLVQVKLNKKWGFINNVGKVVVQPIYDRVDDFREGMASVAPVWGAGYGYINKEGKMVIPVQYKFVYSFSGGVAMVSTDKGHYHIDKTGKVLDGDDKKTIPNTAPVAEKTPSAELACKAASEKLQYAGSVSLAVNTLRKFYTQGDIPVAAYYLAGGFEKGYIHAPKKEIDSAIYYYQKAAVQGYPPAMYCLGRLYQYGTGNDFPTPVAQNENAYLIDKKKSRYWYNEAAKTGNKQALLRVELLDKTTAATDLAAAYMKGYDAFEAKNYQEAYHWWKVSALEGKDADAYYGLAVLHHLGKAPGSDLNTAMEYYQKAADMGMKGALAEKQKILDYFAALNAARQKAATSTASTTTKGESYEQWWEKTYGKGGTQNSRPMPNNNRPTATFRPGAQSESDRHQNAMDQIYRDAQKQMNRSFRNY